MLLNGEVLVRSMIPAIPFLISLTAVAAPLEINKPWSNISDPLIMSTTFIRSWEHLPLEARVADENKYWSGDYWALKRGNINYRWNSPVPSGFNLKSPLKEEALTMSRDQLAALSPSEKFDLLLGRYDYPLKKEVASFTSPSREEWEGMCHGWAPALMHHDEPTPKYLLNPDGIEIPFGSADIKALVSYYYAYKYKAVTSRQMGYRCNNTWWPWGSDRCQDDMNAGAFHLVLTNKIGLGGVSFVADIERGTEVWNHVPVNYKVTVLQDNLPPESDSARGTVKTIRVRAEVFYVFNSQKNTWDPVLHTPLQVEKKRTYEYTLDLNRDNIIIGGNWRSKMRPDFLWLVDAVPEFKNEWKVLDTLL